MSARVELYGIEAEIPPGLFITSIDSNPPHIPMALWGDDGELICGKHLQSASIELFASAAAMRWRDIYTAMERPGEPGARNLVDIGRMDEYDEAREQFGEWNEIRLRAIKDR